MKLLYWKSSKTNDWYFHVIGRNGKIMCQGEGYKRRFRLLETLRMLFPKMKSELSQG